MAAIRHRSLSKVRLCAPYSGQTWAHANGIMPTQRFANREPPMHHIIGIVAGVALIAAIALQDLGILVGQAMATRIMRKLGVREDWAPRSLWLQRALWIVVAVGCFAYPWLLFHRG